MLDVIRESWGWIGLEPAAIQATNDFGNVIVRHADGTYWRIYPEEPSCNLIARTEDEYAALWQSDDFLIGWNCGPLVRMGVAKLGPLSPDRCFCLKVPAILGGPYTEDNIGATSRTELISFSGDLARQLKDAPDGTRFVMKIRGK